MYKIKGNVLARGGTDMDYETMRKVRNESNAFAKFLGISVTMLEEGHAKAELTVQPEHLNPRGPVHGGCLYALADIAATYAVVSYGNEAATTSGEYHYFSPATGCSKIFAKAKVTQRRSKIVYTEVEITSDKGDLLGKGTFIHYILNRQTNT